jgi:hypothetical protein
MKKSYAIVFLSSIFLVFVVVRIGQSGYRFGQWLKSAETTSTETTSAEK